MQKGPGRFELILNLPEVIVLFFVMVALFTGLLFFGYRVGYMHSAKAVQTEAAPPAAAAPAQESPHVEKQVPAVEAEPEIRLENTPAHPGPEPFGVEPGATDAEVPQPLALLSGDSQVRP